MSAPAADVLRPFHWRITGVAGLAFAGNGIDAGVVSFSLPGMRAEWDLTPADLGYILPAFPAGQLVGAVAIGAVADRFGRRVAFSATALIAGLAMGLAGQAPYPSVLAALLFVVGIGFGGVSPAAASLVSEFSPPGHRGRLMAWTQVPWVLGWSVAAVGGGWFERQLGWRGILTLGALPIVIGCLGWVLVPESPRLLLARGRHDAARALSQDLARRHGVHVPRGDPAAPGRPGPPLGRFLALWSRQFRRRTFALWTTWIAMNAALSGPVYLFPLLLATYGTEAALRGTALVGFSMLPGVLASVALIDRLGRRPLMLGSLGLAAAGTAPLLLTDDLVWLTIGAAAIAAGIMAAWPVVLTWSAEQYPTWMRATAAGWASGFARIGAIAAPTILGVLLGPGGDERTLAVLPFAAMLVAAVIGVALFAQETAGRTLEELSR